VVIGLIKKINPIKINVFIRLDSDWKELGSYGVCRNVTVLVGHGTKDR
jgi:hypothetical protein